MALPKKLRLPVLFIVVCFSVVLIGSALSGCQHFVMPVAKITLVEKAPGAQVPGGPYNGIVGHHQKPAPKPTDESPLP